MEEEEALRHAEIWKLMTSFTDSVALKCAVELRIADIIDRYGEPLPLSKIVDNIEDAPSPDISLLQRVMRVLVRRKIFSAELSESGDTLYGMTRASNWILHDTKMTLVLELIEIKHLEQVPQRLGLQGKREAKTIYMDLSPLFQITPIENTLSLYLTFFFLLYSCLRVL